MDIAEFNNVFRAKIKNLIDKGWRKTHLGRLLLGSNGQAHLNHWLNINENGSSNDFGIKPLQKIGKVIDHDVFIVYVSPENHQVVEYLRQLNVNFINEIDTALEKFLDNNLHINPSTIKTSKTQIDNVLDDLLDDIIQ